MKHLKWVGGLMREHKWSYLLGISFLVIEGFAFLAIVGLQKWIIDDVFMNGQYEKLVPIVLMFAGVFICYSLFFILSPYTYFKNSTYLRYKFSHLLLSYLHKIPIKHLQNERTAKFVHYFTNDAAQAAKMIAMRFPGILQQGMMVVILMVVIGLINLQMLIFACVLTATYVIIGIFFSSRLRAISKEVQHKKSDMIIHLEEGISSTREVISYHRNEWETKRYHALFQLFFHKVMLEGKLVNKQIISTEPIKWGAALLFLGYGGVQLMKGNMTLGEFVILYQYSFQLMDTVYYLFQMAMDVSSSMAYLDRIKEVVDGEVVPDGTEDIAGPITDLQFDNLHFAYRDDTAPVINGMNVILPVGKKIAFVGTSGGGKSTISQLLIRFFEPTAGTIRVNGVPLQTIKREDWVRRVDIVFQDPYLLPDTIRANLTLGREDITDERIIAACKTAQIHELIESLPNKYNTEVGERGITLSGGQRQRLALARSFIEDAEILILDEATSALDLETERQVQKSLDEKREGLTTIIIAHRLSTIVNADVIYVIDKGQIIEQGTHNELMVDNSVYKSLVYAQFQQAS